LFGSVGAGFSRLGRPKFGFSKLNMRLRRTRRQKISSAIALRPDQPVQFHNFLRLSVFRQTNSVVLPVSGADPEKTRMGSNLEDEKKAPPHILERIVNTITPRTHREELNHDFRATYKSPKQLVRKAVRVLSRVI